MPVSVKIVAINHQYRACLVCGLIKFFDEFQDKGCENCDWFLMLQNNPDNVSVCTSPYFEGVSYGPDENWLNKCPIKVRSFCEGLYAISVYGRLPSNIVRQMRIRGLLYRPKDPNHRN